MRESPYCTKQCLPVLPYAQVSSATCLPVLVEQLNTSRSETIRLPEDDTADANIISGDMISASERGEQSSIVLSRYPKPQAN